MRVGAGADEQGTSVGERQIDTRLLLGMGGVKDFQAVERSGLQHFFQEWRVVTNDFSATSARVSQQCYRSARVSSLDGVVDWGRDNDIAGIPYEGESLLEILCVAMAYQEARIVHWPAQLPILVG
jgi:hypothetical protein